MPNKRYDEDQDAGLPEKVKGPKGEPAAFKEFKGVEGSIPSSK